jgi:hypothetical protein
LRGFGGKNNRKMKSALQPETVYSYNGKPWIDVTREGESFLANNLGHIHVMHVDKTVEEINTEDELLEALENRRKIVIEA